MLILLKLIILFFTLLHQINNNYIAIDISTNNTQINTLSSYTFTLSRDLNPLSSDFITPSTVPIGSIIQFAFPNDYLSITTSTTIPCTDSQSGLSLICQYLDTTKTITVKNYYTTTATTGNIYPSIKIDEILNPQKSGETGNFVYYIKDSLGIIIDQSPSATNGIYFPRLTFTPGSFLFSKISAQGATILTRSKILVSLTPKNQISSTGKIVMQFPLTWANDIQSNKTVITTPSCTASTNTANTISCTYSPIYSPVNKIYITITGLTSTVLSTAFSFYIQSILTPPVVDSSEFIQISSQAYDNSNIDIFSSVITDLTPIQFQTSAFDSANNTLVQSIFNGRMALNIAKPFWYADTIIFTVPSIFLNATINSTGFSSFSQSKDTSSSSITLSNFPSTSSKSTSSQLNFTFQSISNPISVKPVTITVSFYRLGSLYQQSILSYNAIAGTAQSFKINPTTTSFVNGKGAAQLQIVSTLSISAGARIKISYPSTVTSNDLSQTAVTSATLNGISVTSSQFKVVSNTIIFDNVFQSTFVNGTVLVDFPQFQNPPTVQPSDYLLTVETTDGQTIFTGLYKITATLKGLIRNEISSSSYKVLDTSVLTTTIQLNYLATTISIIIPSDILIKTGFQTTCLPNSLTACYLNGTNLTFEGNFQAEVQTLTWGNVQNPNSFQPSQAFSIFTYNKGFGVQKSLGYIYLQMNQTNIFLSVLVIPSNQKNNQNISVGLTVNFPVSSPAPSILTIVFPPQLDITSSSCNITFLKISNNITFTLISWNSKLQTTISNILNAPSYKPIGDFTVYLVNNNNYNSLYQTKSSWTNNIASSFSTTVSTGDAYRAQNALFKFTLAELSAKQTYSVIKFNNLFGALTTAPTGAILLGPRSVRFDIVNQTTSDLTLTLVTPLVFGQYTFSAETYIQINNISYLIGQSISNIWRHSCYNTLCRRCDSVNNSICLDCYDKSITDYYIFDMSQHTCSRQCLSGYFMSLGNICSLCSNNCLQCLNTSTNCTSCNPLQSLFLDNVYKKCVSPCSDGYYQNTQIQQCLLCSSPCLYCSESATKCTYCPVGKYFLNRDCLTNCPTTKQYIENTVTRYCDLCNSNCLTCENTTTTCISCNTSALLYLQNKKCVLQCQSNSFPNVQTGKCVPCKDPCKLCYNDSLVCSTCLSTSSTPIWYKYGCITESQCPIGNYINTLNSSCDICKAECSACTTLNMCTACNTNYTLYQNNCLSACPNTTYLQNKICLPCTGCLTCHNNYTQCTSCISSQFLYNGKCYTDCPDGLFKNNTSKACQLCTLDCPTCLNTTFCLTCVTDLYLYIGACQISCPVSTFQTVYNSMKVCQQCPTQCLECTSLTQCQACKTGYNLQDDSSCVATCSKGIAYNQICYPCGLHCSNCDKTSQTCQLCDSLYYLYEGKCLQNCPSNTLSLNGLSCVSCTLKFGANCTTCSFDECLSCSDGQLSNGQCIPCPQGTYPRSSKCAPCPAQCRSCYNETNCISCATNYYLELNYCVSTCPLNKIPNGTVCTFCTNNCSTCDLQNSLCSICVSGYYLYEGRCLDQCPLTLVANLNGTKCVTQAQFYQQYSKAAKIIYFPFSITGAVLFIFAIVIKCYSKFTHLMTLSCAVVSVAQIGSWAAFTFVEFEALSNYHFESLKSFALIIVAIGITIMISIVHLIFYVKYLRNDPIFQKWQKNHSCTDKTFLVFSILLNFKIYRIVHSRLLERDQFSMKLNSLNKLLPFSLLSIISLVICSLPAIISSGLALYFSIDQDQQFFAALDCLVITLVMGILILLDLRHESTYFVVEFETENLKRAIYEQDSLKFSVNGQNFDDKNASKAQLISNGGDQMVGNMAEDSGNKLRGQSDLITTGFNQTQKLIKNKVQQQQEQIDQINIDNQEIQFEQISEQGDQAVKRNPKQVSQEHLISQDQQDEQSQKPKQQGPKWIKKQYDRHGYLLKTNQSGQVERYNKDGYRVQIDQNGNHKKFNQDGYEMEMFMGQYCPKDVDGFYLKDDKKFDKRGYEVKINQNGQVQFFDKDGFRVIQDQNGNIKSYDEHGFQIIKDQEGNIHRLNQDGYQAFVSPTGKITYKDKEGNHIRKNLQGEYEIYDPEDGFKIVKNQNGEIQKYDKLGYRIQKDKWGNIYRYDKDGFRIVFGPNNTITRFDKDGYQVIIGPNGEIKRFDKQGYQVRIGQNGQKMLYDENGYEVVKDYDDQITLYDANRNQVVIDPETGQHKKYNSQGLRVIEQQDGTVKLLDNRGHRVVQLADGFYEKFDEIGNKIQLDLFGFEVQYKQNDEIIRYDKVGNVVDQELFQQKLKEQQKLEQQGIIPVKKMKRFKASQTVDFQSELSKMVLAQNANLKEQDSLEQEPKLLQFHDIQTYQEETNFEQQLTQLKNKQQAHEQIDDKYVLDLNELDSVDHHPTKNLKQKQTNVKQVKVKGKFQSGNFIEGDPEQDYIQLKSIADVSINERSFLNEGVQPIDPEDSQYSQLESMDELQPNLALRSKRKRGQHSEMSFIGDQNHDTKTQYKHKTVNVEIKNKNIYDQNEEVQSLNEENWAEQAQGTGGMFYNYNKDLSNANTNTNMNELIFMQDVEDQNDTLSSFVKQKGHLSQKQSARNKNTRYEYDKNTIQQMQNELFEKELDQGIRQRRQFMLSNKPNPLVQYAKNLEAKNKKSLQQRMYFEQVNKKKRRR